MIKESPDKVTDLPSTGQSANQGDQVRNRSHQHTTEWQIGDGAKVLFFLPKTPRNEAQLMVFVDGRLMRPSERGTTYDYTRVDARITFAVAPANTKNICFAQVGV